MDAYAFGTLADKAPSPATHLGRFILYARKSTDREDKQVQSIPDQLALAARDAAARGMRVVRTLDEARSAKRQGQRPGFQELLAALETGEADGVICWHPDRLARNAVDGGWIIDLLDRGKLKHLHFVSSYHFENTPEGKMMLSIVFTQAKYQVDKLSGDVTRGMNSRRDKGGFPHRAPVGYLNARDGRGDKVVAADPDRFPKLRRAVELILQDGYTPADALRYLNGTLCFRTRPYGGSPGHPLHRSAFYRLLQNPFLYGSCRAGDGLYAGTHPPLVSEAEFARLQRVLRRPASVRRVKHGFTYGGGLLTCGRCGCAVTATRSKEHVYYHCTNMKGVCDRKGAREESVESEVCRLLSRIELPDPVEEVLVGLTVERVRKIAQDKEGDGRARRERIAALRGRRERLLDLVVDGALGREEFAAARGKIDDELRELERMERAGDGAARRAAEEAEAAVRFAVHARREFAGADAHRRRESVRTLAEKRILTGRIALLELHPYLDVIARHQPAVMRLQTLDNGYQSTKKTPLGASASFGSPCVTAVELDGPVLSVLSVLAEELAAEVTASERAFSPYC